MSSPIATAAVASTLAAILIQTPLAVSYMILPALFNGASFAEMAGPLVFIAFWVSLVSAVFVIAVGLPVFFVLYRKKSASVLNVGLAGLLIAWSSALFALWPVGDAGSSYSATTPFGYRDLLVDGVPTYWGWLKYIINTATFGLHGLVGALAFVVIWRKLSGAKRAA